MSNPRMPQDSARASSKSREGSIDLETPWHQRQRASVPFSVVLKALVPAAVLLIAVFWVNTSHLYGLFLHQGKYVHRAHVALADFDGGGFGDALRRAAVQKNGTYEFPTFVTIDTSASSPEKIRHDVFTGRYWGAIIVQPGATGRFEQAVNGTAASYDPTAVYTYTLMPSRYYTFYVSSIQTSAITTASMATGIFSGEYVSGRLVSGHFANTTTAASALAVPAQAVSASAAPYDYTELDDKAFTNTVGTVFPILMQFFFIMAWNGISNSMHAYAAYDLRTHIWARLLGSTVWPLLTALCTAGWTFAFRGSYHLDAKMFFAYWAVTWVFCMINFDLIDILTGFVPMAFVPFFILTWVIFSVAASIGPETILHHWYRISYFFPSLHWYQTFITIISSGGINRLHYTLPTLAGWLVLAKCLSPLATRNRVTKAKEVFQYYSERDALNAPH